MPGAGGNSAGAPGAPARAPPGSGTPLAGCWPPGCHGMFPASSGPLAPNLRRRLPAIKYQEGAGAARIQRPARGNRRSRGFAPARVPLKPGAPDPDPASPGRRENSGACSAAWRSSNAMMPASLLLGMAVRMRAHAVPSQRRGFVHQLRQLRPSAVSPAVAARQHGDDPPPHRRRLNHQSANRSWRWRRAQAEKQRQAELGMRRSGDRRPGRITGVAIEAGQDDGAFAAASPPRR